MSSPPARVAAMSSGTSVSPDVSQSVLFGDSGPKPSGFGWSALEIFILPGKSGAGKL